MTSNDIWQKRANEVSQNSQLKKSSLGVRKEIAAFGVYVALTLFQTDVYHLGTLASSLTILAILWLGLSGRSLVHSRYKLTITNVSVILFLVTSLLTSIITYGLPNYTIKLLSQATLILLFSQYTLREEEDIFVRNAFITSMTVYGLLIIRSRYLTPLPDWNTHSRIELFGTTLDPNYVGMPLVSCEALLLHDLIERKGSPRVVIEAIIVLSAILYTASHGVFLGLLFSSIMIIVLYLISSDKSIPSKMGIVLLMSLAYFFVSWFVTRYFHVQWNRMTSFAGEVDNGRFRLWSEALELWKTSPLFGIGLQGMYVKSGMVTHNTFLQVLTETGVLGLICFMCFYFSIISRTLQRSPTYCIIALALALQMCFLDALDNRCFWTMMCWFCMLPRHPNSADVPELS